MELGKNLTLIIFFSLFTGYICDWFLKQKSRVTQSIENCNYR